MSLRKSCSSKKRKKLYLLGCVFSMRWVYENISICILVPETVAIMYFSLRRGHETSSSNHHAFFPRDAFVEKLWFNWECFY